MWVAESATYAQDCTQLRNLLFYDFSLQLANSYRICENGINESESLNELSLSRSRLARAFKVFFLEVSILSSVS